MIIDFHTHAFPDRICERTIEILQENIVRQGNPPCYAVGTGNVSGLQASMAADGIDYSLVLPIATAPRQTENINSFAIQINGRNGIFSFGSLHPAQDNCEEILEGVKAAGLRGIKLHPDYQDFFIDSPESVRILKKCEELGLYTILHAGNDHGCPPPVHCTPERLARVLDHVSGRYIIAAHMGGWTMWDDAEKYIIGTPIMIDVCFSLHIMSPTQAVRMIRNHGADKVLFGSDWPWYSQKRTAELLKKLPLTEEEFTKILSGNAAKILGITEMEN